VSVVWAMRERMGRRGKMRSMAMYSFCDDIWFGK
jgi:hypothetical protein